MQNNLNVDIHLPYTPDFEGVFQQQESNSIVMIWVEVELDSTFSFLCKTGRLF